MRMRVSLTIKTYRLFMIFLICCGILTSACRKSGSSAKNGSKTSETKWSKQEPKIRVLLTSASQKSCIVSTSGVYRIVDAYGKILLQGEQLGVVQIYANNSSIYLGNQASGDRITIQPGEKTVVYVNRIGYRGTITCIAEKAKMSVVNTLPMEMYVAGVVGGEMPLSWPKASLQSQAIIARTFALYEKNHASKPHFDVYDSTASQVYKGISQETQVSWNIVEETRGIVLLYQNAIFKTFFHSSCGGHTANGNKVFAYHDITPLSGRTCVFCQDNENILWEHRVNVVEFQQMLLNMKLPTPFLGIVALEKDAHERLFTMQLLFGKGQRTSISAVSLRNRLGNDKIRSTAFVMEATTDGILFKGKGWGHGVGLCQTGTRTMGLKGFSASEILQFYYPGVTLYRLW